MNRYFIDAKEVTYEEFHEALETAVDNYCEDTFDEYLDNLPEGEVNLLGITYSLHHVLWETDPIRYNVMLSDYQSAELAATEAEFAKGLLKELELYGTDFRVKEVEEEYND